MPSFDIKKASIDDVEEILQLQKQAYLSEADLYNDIILTSHTNTRWYKTGFSKSNISESSYWQ